MNIENLQSSTLEFPLQCIRYTDINLWSIKCSIPFIYLAQHAKTQMTENQCKTTDDIINNHERFSFLYFLKYNHRILIMQLIFFFQKGKEAFQVERHFTSSKIIFQNKRAPTLSSIISYCNSIGQKAVRIMTANVTQKNMKCKKPQE